MTDTTNSNLDPQTETASLAHVSADEQPYEGAGFPGCGDGSDDFADMNANEADDYAYEGCDGVPYYGDDDDYYSGE
jgi:hypothetical protein